MLKTLSHSFLSLIYPQECNVCHGEVESPDDGVACSACWTETRIFDQSETLCTKCGAFLFGARNSLSPTQCHRCEDHDYDFAFAVGVYELALSASVLRLKRVPHVPSRLKRLLTDAVVGSPISADTVIVPVPLSKRRLHERGFNQAERLARSISHDAGFRLDLQSFVREADTPMHRVGMDAKAREKTVRGAFRVTRPKLIDGRSILLVDDVFTSGSTASVCAKTLKENGAAIVNVVTIARAA